MRLHADCDASRSIVISLTKRDADPAIPGGMDRVHEDPQTLIQGCRARDIVERCVKGEIVISVTKQRANARAKRGR